MASPAALAGGVRRRRGPELRGEGRAPVGLQRGQGDDTRYVHAPPLPDVLAVALVIVAALQLTAAAVSRVLWCVFFNARACVDCRAQGRPCSRQVRRRHA